MTPLYEVNKLEMRFIPKLNRTLLSLVFTENREEVEKTSFIINNFTIPFLAFMTIVVCTAILVLSLGKRTSWLQSVKTTATDELSTRNRRVAKMVVMISAIFSSCFVPVTIIMMIAAFDPRFGVGGKYFYLNIVTGGTAVLLEAVNSSVNIFIYYHMSSKYRQTFLLLFKGKQSRKDATYAARLRIISQNRIIHRE